MTKTLSICAALLLLAGCEPPQQTWHYDQTLRQHLFLMCLEKAPAGPQSTRYNDWSEVVDECGEQSRQLAIVDPVTHKHPVIGVEK